ncbi:MAG: LapA family protein [Thermodesulfobacteriota bacterium]
MRYLKLFAFIIFFVLAMIFFVQNTEPLSSTLELKFDLFQWSWLSNPLPFYVVVLIAFAVGAVLSLLYFLVEKMRLSGEVKKHKNQVRSLEKELNSLRNMPLEESNYQKESNSLPSTELSHSGEDAENVSSESSKEEAPFK